MLRSRALALAGLLVGCTHAPPAKIAVVAPAPSPPPSPEATGRWDWVYRSTDPRGNLRLEMEEWHLTQKGQRIQGYYDRVVTLMSTDEHPFACNQQLGFSRATRVQVEGMAIGEHVMLRELAFEVKPGPCEDGARALVSYTGSLHGDTLDLEWGAPNAAQTLFRAPPDRPPVLGETFGPPDPARPVASTGKAPLAGTWEWELKSIDAEGDERIEHEEWHLTEADDAIRGFYERKVTRVRGDGKFTCNAADRYETLTRYTISGQRRGDRITLTETHYEVPSATVSKCDNGLRRLDSYQGTVSSDGEELTLSWGPGNQLLRRQK